MTHDEFCKGMKDNPMCATDPCVMCKLGFDAALKTVVPAQQPNNTARDAIAALRDLYTACVKADEICGLSECIDGSLLDRVKAVLQQHQ